MADFTCPVCSEDYDTSTHEPRSLGCGHTLCAQCTEQIMNGVNGSNFCSLICPTCRKQNYYNERVPTNYAIKGAVETIMALEKELEEGTRTRKRKLEENTSAREEGFGECNICEKMKSFDDLIACEQCDRMLVCVGCFLSKHQGHKVISYTENQVAQLRHKTHEKLKSHEKSMEEAKRKLYLNIMRLVKVWTDDEKVWKWPKFATATSVLVADVEREEDAKKLVNECADVSSSYIERLNDCSNMIEKIEQEMIATAVNGGYGAKHISTTPRRDTRNKKMKLSDITTDSQHQ